MKSKIKIGDIYEDCAFHLIWCTGIDTTNDDIYGISLFNGHERHCSINHCGARKLTPKEISAKIMNRDKWIAALNLYRETENISEFNDSTKELIVQEKG